MDADNVNYAYAKKFVATILLYFFIIIRFFIIRTSSEKCAAVASECIYKIQCELSNRYTCVCRGRETVQQLIKPCTLLQYATFVQSTLPSSSSLLNSTADNNK